MSSRDQGDGGQDATVADRGKRTVPADRGKRAVPVVAAGRDTPCKRGACPVLDVDEAAPSIPLSLDWLASYCPLGAVHVFAISPTR